MVVQIYYDIVASGISKFNLLHWLIASSLGYLAPHDVTHSAFQRREGNHWVCRYIIPSTPSLACFYIEYNREDEGIRPDDGENGKGVKWSKIYETYIAKFIHTIEL